MSPIFEFCQDDKVFFRYEGMTQPLSRYHARAPRYILQPHDNTLIRVAGPRQTPWEEATRIHNISLSGLAFTAPPDLCPIVGEIIKIQFEIPGAGQMACFGLVTRLQPQSSSSMLVGVQFKKLELAQRIALAQALALKLRDQMKDYPETPKSFRDLWNEKRNHILMATGLLMIWCTIFYVFSTIFSST